MALLLGDLDGLKARNDSAGHEAGDLALRLVGQVLQQACSSDMLAARIGGDAFGVILAGGGVRSAEELSSEVDRRLAAADRGIGVSWGSAEYGPGVTGPSDLLRAADAALYARKSERNPAPPARPDRRAPDRRRRRSGASDGAWAVLEFIREGLALLDGEVGARRGNAASRSAASPPSASRSTHGRSSTRTMGDTSSTFTAPSSGRLATRPTRSAS